MTKLIKSNKKSNVKTPEFNISQGNSTANQTIKGKFIQREVLLCASYMMDELFKAANDNPTGADLPNFEDIENLYAYPEYYGTYAKFSGGTDSDREAEINRLRELQEEYDSDEVAEAKEAIYDAIRDEIAELENLETETQEIFEWWAVSEWLKEKLREKGEPTMEYANIHFWGRCCTGQAILLDHVITQICADLEILEHQKSSWAEK